MHKSKLGGFIIDCCTDDLKTAADFWSQALGLPVREPPGSESKSYRSLHDVHTGLDIEVQKVDHPSRVHLDIKHPPANDSAWCVPPRRSSRSKHRLGVISVE